MLLHGENVHSPAFWDLPLWSPDYVIFFGVLYAVLLVLGIGLGIVFMRALRESRNDDSHTAH